MPAKNSAEGVALKEVKEALKKCVLLLLFVLMLGFTLYGCSTTQSSSPTSLGAGSEIVTSAPLTSDFEDIPIPAELKKDLGKSFIFETSSIKTAIIYYDSFPGYLDHSSLVIFFKNNMVAHGWKLIDIYSYKEANLSFEKGNRMCHINIFDKFLQTKVVIKVGQVTQPQPAK